MTAFAAIVTPGDESSDLIGTASVAARLTAVAGTTARAHVASGCVLVCAPLHATDPDRPLVHLETGVAIAGQVLLEAPHALARDTGVQEGASDLAIALAAFLRWGDRCTERLTGEYAFSVWDPRRRALVCARDGLGIRLLYVAEGTRAIVATNVLDAAVDCSSIDPALDEVALATFLINGTPAQNRTAYRAIRVLPAAHTLTVARGRASLVRHWRFPDAAPSRVRPWQEMLDGYRETLSVAVADRVRRAPAAVLMSGGVDSTTIAAAAREHLGGGQLHAFTAIYGQFSSVDELPLARLAADALEIPLTAVVADRHTAMDTWSSGIRIPQPFDEPMLSDWRSFVGEASKHASVALYGEDGDALFLPPGLRGLRREMSLAPLAGSVLGFLRAERRLPYLGIRLRERLRLIRRTVHDAPHWVTQAGHAVVRDTAPAHVFGARFDPAARHASRPRTQRRLEQPTGGWLATLIAPEVTGHRMELRLPLFDSRVLKFVLEAPAIPWCQQKALPRHAYRGRLPDAILDRPKTGLPGFDDALVASWRACRPDLPSLAPPLDAWVDVPTWKQILATGDWRSVQAAWRVLQVHAWLQHRCRASGPENHACTA